MIGEYVKVDGQLCRVEDEYMGQMYLKVVGGSHMIVGTSKPDPIAVQIVKDEKYEKQVW